MIGHVAPPRRVGPNDVATFGAVTTGLDNEQLLIHCHWPTIPIKLESIVDLLVGKYVVPTCKMYLERLTYHKKSSTFT